MLLRTLLYCVSLILIAQGLESSNGTQTIVNSAPGFESNFDFTSMIGQLLPSSSGDIEKQAAQALQYLKFMFVGDDPQNSPGEACLNDVTEMLQSLLSREQWAIRSKFSCMMIVI